MKNSKFKIATAVLFAFALHHNSYSQNTLWSTRFDPAGQVDKPKAITTDLLGNVYVTGQSANVSGLPTDYNIATIKYNNLGVQQWAASYNDPGGPANEFNESGQAIAVDDAGYVYVAGNSIRTFPIGNEQDIVLLVYNPSGTLAYSATIGGGSISGMQNDCARAISIQNVPSIKSTDVYIAGAYQNDAAVVKYRFNKQTLIGSYQWLNTYAGPAGGIDYFSDVKCDVSNSLVYATGMTAGGPSTLNNCVTRKFYSSGGTVWTSLWNGPNNSNDESNSIQFTNTLNPGVFICGATTTPATGVDGLLIKYDLNGNLQWSKTYTDGFYNQERFNSLCLDAQSKSVYVSGYGIGDLSTTTDYLTMKFKASDGQIEWSSPAFYDGAGTGNCKIDVASAIVVSPWTGKIYVSGTTSDQVVGTSCFTNISTICYSSTKTLEWVKSYDYTGDKQVLSDEFRGLAISYDDCKIGDFVHVTGTSAKNSSTDVDFVTLKYGSPPPCVDQKTTQYDRVDDILSVEIYPNPVFSLAQIRINKEDLQGELKIDIYNMVGEKVKSLSYHDGSELIFNRAGLTSGIYVYTINNGKQSGWGKLIID